MSDPLPSQLRSMKSTYIKLVKKGQGNLNEQELDELQKIKNIIRRTPNNEDFGKETDGWHV